MKIRINENENYIIDIPEEINGNDFLDLIEKLLKLSKFIQISSFNINNKKVVLKNSIKREPHNINRRKFFDTKEKLMDILQYYYHGTKEDTNRIARICGYSNFEFISKRLSNKRKNFNIQPSEIGFIKMPTTTDRRGVKINGWIIKSYTGMFDEKDEETIEEDGTDNTN